VLEQFWPSHDTRRGVWGNEVRASALGEGANLFAHVDAHSSKLVLYMHAVLEVLNNASLLALRALNLQLGSLFCPSLELAMTPLRQIVQVLKQLWPSHDTWSRVWGDEVGASAFGERTNLLAHVNANSSELILQQRPVLQVSCGASGSFDLQLGSLAIPSLELAMTPLGQVVHVLEQFWPSHDTRRGVWSNKVWASALREGADLFAHVDAHSGKLILHMHAVLQVLNKASLFALGALNLQLGCLLCPSLELTMAPLRQVVQVLEQLWPSHDTWS